MRKNVLTLRAPQLEKAPQGCFFRFGGGGGILPGGAGYSQRAPVGVRRLRCRTRLVRRTTCATRKCSHPPRTAKKKSRLFACSFSLAEAEGFEPPWACTQTVFKFRSAFVAYRLLLLFNSPNCRKISVLTALLSDNSGFLLCFGIVPRSLAFLIFSAFLTAFCRDFVDE